MKTRTRPAILAILAVALAPALASAGSSAHDIVIRALDAHEARLAKVETVTITQSIMGMESVVVMEKEVVDGHAVLVPRRTTMRGMEMPIGEDGKDHAWAAPFGNQRELADLAKLEGEEKVDGHACHVLVVEDFGDLDFMQPPGPPQGDMDMRIERGRFLVGKDDLLMRRMEMSGQAKKPDGTMSPVTMTMTFADYRETNGYMHPYHTTMSMTGMMEASGNEMDADELAESLAEMKEQMASMPESMQGMIQSQIDRLEGMLEGGGMTMEIVVQSIEVS